MTCTSDQEEVREDFLERSPSLRAVGSPHQPAALEVDLQTPGLQPAQHRLQRNAAPAGGGGGILGALSFVVIGIVLAVVIQWRARARANAEHVLR